MPVRWATVAFALSVSLSGAIAGYSTHSKGGGLLRSLFVDEDPPSRCHLEMVATKRTTPGKEVQIVTVPMCVGACPEDGNPEKGFNYACQLQPATKIAPARCVCRRTKGSASKVFELTICPYTATKTGNEYAATCRDQGCGAEEACTEPLTKTETRQDGQTTVEVTRTFCDCRKKKK